MSRDKQIEKMNELDEIAKILYEANGDSYDTTYQHDCEILAEVIYNAGYRKSTDVAEEIFAEIEGIAMHGTTPFGLCLMSMGEAAFARLKKKYTQEK